MVAAGQQQWAVSDMSEAKIINTITPDPDSHYRLIPCGCGSDKIVYEQYSGLLWRVRCPACGHTVDRGCAARHDAQVAWNRERMEETL